jgi:hypothetical protein
LFRCVTPRIAFDGANSLAMLRVCTGLPIADVGDDIRAQRWCLRGPEPVAAVLSWWEAEMPRL